MRIENHTPCRVLAFDRRGPDGVARRVFVVKGTFRQSTPQGPLVPVGDARAADPIEGADTLSPDGATLDVPHEVAMAKARAEVLVLGAAKSPRGEAREVWPVSLAVGGREKRLLVTGPRRYERRDGRWRCGRPAAVTSVPLTYALAWGGGAYAPNPAGVGWRASSSVEPGVAPQVVYADEPEPDPAPHATHTPAGLAALAPWWTPRSLARTPAEAALCAMPDQWFEGLAPGTPVALRGISPAGAVEFTLPREALLLDLADAEGTATQRLSPDTVTVLVDRGVVTMLWRATAPAATGPWRARFRFEHEVRRG